MRKQFFILFIILSNIVFISCSQQEDIELLEQTNIVAIEFEHAQIDCEIAKLINAYRASKNLSKLNLINQASIEAKSHSLYMAGKGKISHDNFSSRSKKLKIIVSAKVVVENVGFGYSSAQSIVSAWLNSESHKKNIENPELTGFGIATYIDKKGNNYFTNIFIQR